LPRQKKLLEAPFAFGEGIHMDKNIHPAAKEEGKW